MIKNKDEEVAGMDFLALLPDPEEFSPMPESPGGGKGIFFRPPFHHLDTVWSE
jgi:hypothetical protein